MSVANPNYPLHVIHFSYFKILNDVTADWYAAHWNQSPYIAISTIQVMVFQFLPALAEHPLRGQVIHCAISDIPFNIVFGDCVLLRVAMELHLVNAESGSLYDTFASGMSDSRASIASLTDPLRKVKNCPFACNEPVIPISTARNGFRPCNYRFRESMRYTIIYYER
jgi:hypothetical protein